MQTARHESLTGEKTAGWIIYSHTNRPDEPIYAYTAFYDDLEVAHPTSEKPEGAACYAWHAASMGYFWVYATEIAAQKALRRLVYLARRLYCLHMGRINEYIRGRKITLKRVKTGQTRMMLPPQGQWWFDFEDFRIELVYTDQMKAHRWHNEGEGSGKRVVDSWLVYVGDECCGEVRSYELFPEKMDALQRARKLTENAIHVLKAHAELTDHRISVLKGKTNVPR